MARDGPAVPDGEVDVVPGMEYKNCHYTAVITVYLWSFGVNCELSANVGILAGLILSYGKMLTVLSASYLIRVRLTSAGSVSTTTGMAKLKKQFLKDSNS